MGQLSLFVVKQDTSLNKYLAGCAAKQQHAAQTFNPYIHSLCKYTQLVFRFVLQRL